ncbi:MAG: glycosyltransferase family 2 protein [Chloroflexota bacterium]|nr:MAG: glycosyltransferase family 2 protein [Chloroflexota bacterium]
MPDISFVVANWNGGDLLRAGLATIAAQRAVIAEIVVVDNGSTDGSLDGLDALATRLSVISLGKNHGFAVATNVGMRRSIAPWIATVNNDCRLAENWAERALARASDDRAGSIATLTVRADDAATIDSAGIALDRVGIAWDRAGGHTRVDDEVAPLFGPSGAAALYRRAMLDDVGLFDPEFFMYYEDVDLAWRARLRGWECSPAFDAVARHVGSASAGRNSPTKRRLLARNKIWTFVKCATERDMMAWAIPAIAYDAVAAGAYVVAAPSSAVDRSARVAALRGRIDAFRGLHRQLAKRKSIQGRRAIDSTPGLAPLVGPRQLRARFAHLPEGGAVKRS